MSPDKLVKRLFHVGCQDKKGPGKIHDVIPVLYTKQNKLGSESSVSCLKQGSQMSNFCLTQGQGLKALGEPPTQTSSECPPEQQAQYLPQNSYSE